MLCLFTIPYVAPTLTIGPELVSYRDLATALTQSGTSVKCDDHIARRIAMVSLHNRPLVEAEQILGAALGVSFQVQSDGTLLMLSDPKASAQKHKALGNSCL